MGKILQKFHDNREVILKGLSLNLSKIVDLLQKKGVYKEEETHGLLDDTLYNIVKNIFSRVDAGGYYAEFVDALTEAGEKNVAKLVRLPDCYFTKELEDRNITDIGSAVTLSCSLEEEYVVRWYKGQCEIFLNDKFKFKNEEFKHQLIIADIQEEDSGVYYCKCGTTTTRCVLKVADCSFTTKLEDINVIGIGSNVTLSCCLDKELDVQWYKNNEEINLNDKFKFKDERFKHQLIIADIQEEDSGVYYCKCGTTKTRCVLKVEDCSFSTKLEDINVIGIGSNVTLSCCLDKEFDVQWNKDDEEINLNDKFKFKDERFKHQLIIADIQEENSGVYYCKCGTTNTRCVLKVEDCSFTAKLEDINVIGIGSNVTLSCCLDKEFDVQWNKDDEEINLNDKFKFKDERFKHQLIIADIQEENSGVYSCHCGTTKTRCVLKIEANRFIKQLKDVTINEGEKLILACELDEECTNVKWSKTNGAVSFRATTPNNKTAGRNAHRYKLELNLIKMEDAGEYRCHNENVITTCNVTVKRIQEIQIDDSVPTTTLLYALNSTKDRLRVTKDELLHTKTELEKAKSDIRQTEISKRETETETAQIRALLKKKEDMLRIKESELVNKESELENKENCIKELRVENKQLAVSVEKLESISKVLESTRKQSAQMEEHIEKLEGEKHHLEGRVSSLESYINAGKISDQQDKFYKQQQQVLEEIKSMIEEKNKSKVCSVS